VVAAAPAPVRDPDVVRHVLDDDALVAELARFGATPAELLAEPELMGIFLPTIRADFRLAETYRADGRMVQCDVIAYAGTEDHDVAVDDVAEWAELTRGKFILHEIVGNHFFPDVDAALIMAGIRGSCHETF
jgi:surfactin synthase thioesterase subunit